MKKERKALYCNLFLPGLGQWILDERLKGTALFLLQSFLFWRSHAYETLMQSMEGDIQSAISHIQYNWYLFHPGFYFFSLWDVYKKSGAKPYAYVPFVSAVYAMTTGMFLSEKARIFGRLWGPIWFPLLCLLPGVSIGYILQRFMKKNAS